MSQYGQRIFLGLLLAALLPFLLQIAWPFVSAFVLASVVATVLYPANSRLSRRLQRPGLGSLLTTLATVIVLETIFGFVCVRVFKDVARVHHALNQRSLEQGGWPVMITHTSDRIVEAVAKRLPVAKEPIRAELLAGMKIGARYLVSQTRAAIEHMMSILVTTVLANIFLYYLLRYGEGWLRRGAALVPLSPHTTAKLLRVAHQSIVANVNGVLVVALAQGLFLSLGFWFVDIGSPLLWGMFGAIASVVPFVGATLVWVPAVIGLVLMGSYWKALVLGLWAAIVVGSVDNIVRPLVVGAQEKEDPMLLGFAMLGGTYALGPLGIILGPLVVSLTGAVIEEIQMLGPSTKAVSIKVINDQPEQTPETASQTKPVSADFETRIFVANGS